ncbi:Ig-like domain-containing protein [Microcoleus sp. Z1_C4]|uniref:Ig-like domain-containing protein n=1 Tax=Microcoleus sp. Z1_C4 TaxID=3055432 RepID=UPI002FD25E83
MQGNGLDGTAPTASSFTPADNATNITVAADLVVTLSEAVQKGIGNIVIKKVSDNSVVETIDVTSANVTVTGSTVTVNPTADLAPGTDYYVEIAAGAIKNLGGNNYAGTTGATAWNFSTAAAVDTTAPTATFTPADNATSVAVAADLVVTLSEAVQKGIGNIVIKKVSDNSVVETIDVTSTNVTVSGSTVTINPLADLAPGTDYYVEIAAGAIKDLAGNNYAGTTGATAWNFTTAAAVDTTAPTATFTPADNATSVAVAGDLVVTLSEAVQKGIGNIVIKKVSDNSVVETINVTAANVTVTGSTVTVNPTADLAPGTDYYVEIAAGAIKDLAGNNYAGTTGATAWNFTTAAAVDTTAPTATFTPADNATSVAVAANLVVNLSEAVQKGIGNIVIKKVSDNSVVETINVTAANVTVTGSTVTVNPTADLAPGTDYYVEIAAGAIKDLAGNNYAGTTGATAWNFNTATAVDTTPPTVTLASNAGATVKNPFNVTATFNENVTGFIASDISLTNATVSGFTGTGSNYNFTVTPTGSGIVTVNVPASSATDAAGNNNITAAPLTRTFDSRIENWSELDAYLKNNKISVPNVEKKVLEALVPMVKPLTAEFTNNELKLAHDGSVPFANFGVLPLVAQVATGVTIPISKPSLTLSNLNTSAPTYGLSGKINFADAKNDGKTNFLDFINEQLKIKEVELKAEVRTGVVPKVSLSAELSTENLTLLKVDPFSIEIGGAKLSVSADSTSPPNFGIVGSYLIKGYDPFQTTEPELTFSGGLTFDPKSITGALQLTAKTPWKNPFGLPDSEIRNLALQVGGTYAPPWVDNVGFVGDLKFGNFDLKSAFFVSSNDPKKFAVELTANAPVNLVDLLAGPVYSYVIKQVGKEVDFVKKAESFLRQTLNVNIVSVDGPDADTKFDPLLKLVPLETEIAETKLTQGLGINGKVTAWGKEASLSLNANPYAQSNPSLEGVLQIPEIDLGFLKLTGADGPNDKTLDFAVKVSPTEQYLKGDGKLEIFGQTVAKANVEFTTTSAKIKDFDLNLGVVALDINDFSVDIAKKTVSGSGSVKILGREVAGAKIKADSNGLKVEGNLDLFGVLSIENALIDIKSPTDIKIGGTAKIFGQNLGSADISLQNGKLTVKGFIGYNLPLVGNVGANLEITSDGTASGSKVKVGYEAGVLKGDYTVSLAPLRSIEELFDKVTGGALGAATEAVNKAIDGVVNGFNSVSSGVLDTFNKIGNFFEGAFNSVLGWFGGPSNGRDDKWLDDGNNKYDAKGGDDYIRGKGGDDHLILGSGNDKGEGWDGNDRIEGNDNNDTLHGDGGNDKLEGGWGRDILRGGGGDDILQGQQDIDYLYGEDGNDKLEGNEDKDTLDGGSGSDFLYGNAGDDLLFGIDGADLLDGGDGNDTLNADSGNDRVFGQNGNDLMKGQDGNDELHGYQGNDTIEGGNDNDVLYGQGDKDFLQGGDGDDVLYGEDNGKTGGNYDGSNDKDTLEGGNGKDTLFGGLSDDLLLGGNDDDILSGEAGNDILRGEAGNDFLDGGGGNDSLNGEDGSDSLFGRGGNDFLEGFGGKDYLNGGDGNDRLFSHEDDDILRGEGGNDHLASWTGNDALDGGDGNDSLYGEGDNDTLSGGNGSNVLDGGDGTDTADYRFSTGAVDVNLNNGKAQFSGNTDLLTSIENVIGSANNDLVIGNAGNNTLSGQAGNDILLGEIGNDLLSGNEGNDEFHGWEGNDTLEGGTGNDTLYGQQNDDWIRGGDGNDALYGEGNGSPDSTSNDLLFGDAGDDSLFGGVGIDNLNGGDGDDYLAGGTGNDNFNADVGNDTIDGGDGNDNLNGGDGNDSLFGGIGDDYFNAGTGNDLIIGGEGNDTLFLLGNNSDYKIRETSTGWEVIAANGDVKTVIGVENFRYQNYSNDTLTGTQNNDTLQGGEGNSLIYGRSGNDFLSGGEGNDKLYGEEGNDNLDGGAGDDSFFAGTGSDTINGGRGFDRLFLSGPRTDYKITPTSTGRQLTTSKGDITIVTWDVEDILYEMVSNDSLTGTQNNDALQGGQGNSLIYGRSGNDSLSGGGGNDTVYGEEGNDNLDGGAGDDNLYPGAGSDIINGRDGFDTLFLSGKQTDYKITGTLAQGRIAGPNGSFKTITGLEKIVYEPSPTGNTGSQSPTGNTGSQPFGSSFQTQLLRKLFRGLRIIDGYIANGKVFLDANLNGTLDDAEPFTITKADGSFDLNVDIETFDTNQNGEIDYTEGQFVLMGGMDIIGGVDVATGLPMATPLISTVESTVVTPLTTIIAELVKQGIDPLTAQTQVESALEIPAGLDLGSYDPLEAIAKGDANGVSVFGSMILVQNTIVQTAKFIEGVSETAIAQLAFSGIGAIANQLKGGAAVDLGKTETILAILQAAITKAAESDPKINPTQLVASAAAAAQIMALGNQMVKDLVASGRPIKDIALEITKLQAVSVGQIAVGLSDLAAGTVTVEQFLAQNTKEAILARMETVKVNDPTVRPVVETIDGNSPIDPEEPTSGEIGSAPDTETGTDTPTPIAPTRPIAPTPSVTASETPTTSETASETPTPSETATPTPTTNNLSDDECICDTITYPNLNRPNSVENTILGASGLQIGTAQNDELLGSDTANIFEGKSGDDNIYGGADNDIINGNQGNDFIAGGKDEDTLYGDEGSDIVLGESGNDLIFGGKGNDFLHGREGIDIIYGNKDDDFIDGGKDNDTLYGGKGNDILLGSQGDDNLFGQQGNDTICGGEGNDLINGDEGADILGGCAGNDTLFGGADNDTLTGGKGNDLLDGGMGNDSLIGGSGNDIFALKAGQGFDIIADFTLGQDLIGLSGGLSFGQLEITQNTQGTLIKNLLTGEQLGVMVGVSANAITSANFMLV